MSNKAIHFPILINAPKEIPLTVSQFDNMSVMGLSSFMINYPMVIADYGDHIRLYCEEHRARYFHDMPRFAEVIPGKVYEEVELGFYVIPKTTKLYATINKYFKHLYLKAN